MSKHRDSPGSRRRTAGNRHRADVRPRYGRLATLGSSLAVVAIAVLGGTGALPSSADDQPKNDPGVSLIDEGSAAGADASSEEAPETAVTPSASPQPDDAETDDAEQDDLATDPSPTDPPGGSKGGDPTTTALKPIDPADAALTDAALPADSGSGRRIVFSESRQRVWLVTDDGVVERTYLVSGSIYDNLDPGTFDVYSRSEDAIGIDDSGTMKYFVRFTQGDEGAAIGFHDIPIDDGVPVQTFKQLGTPLSHGCIRQRRSDAIALWEFAPIGTTVVVTA